MTSNVPILEVKGLHVRFPIGRSWRGSPVSYVNALQDVSLTLHDGESLGIVGESGSGKSTLALAIIGLVPPSSGEVRFKGTLVSSKSKPRVRASLAYQLVFQDPKSSLDPRMRVWEIITEGIEIRRRCTPKQRRTKAEEWASLVGLEASFLDRFPHEFSGGQRQRISIARALALEPKLLILDEPTSALDVSVQAQLLNLLLRLQNQLGLSFLLISHDIGVVNHMCDRIVVMKSGAIVEQGPTEDVLLRPQEAYTRQLLESIPRVG